MLLIVNSQFIDNNMVFVDFGGYIKNILLLYIGSVLLVQARQHFLVTSNNEINWVGGGGGGGGGGGATPSMLINAHVHLIKS